MDLPPVYEYPSTIVTSRFDAGRLDKRRRACVVKHPAKQAGLVEPLKVQRACRHLIKRTQYFNYVSVKSNTEHLYQDS